MSESAPFHLCLTHDVDRPYKTYQSLYYAVADRDPYHLRTLLSRERPYWQFESVMALERELGVRSAFYFLEEEHLFADRPPREWLRPASWKLYLGRYSLDDPAIAAVIRRLDAGGWEVGLHGSYRSYDDRELLGRQKRTLEAVLGHPVRGCRQHYLNRRLPDTWEHQAAVGLRYDTTPGSATVAGFGHGYDPLRPFDDDFLVFPLTVMENALPDPGERFDAAWATCEALLEEAAANGAVMTVLWHQNKFNPREYPGHRRLYRRLVERADELGAWIGPPGELYDRLVADDRPDAGHGARTAHRLDTDPDDRSVRRPDPDRSRTSL